MPFDDFIALRNLTTQVDPIKTKNGGARYLANHPDHGSEVEASSAYAQTLASAQSAMAAVTSGWQNKMAAFTHNVNSLKTEFNNVNYETVTIEEKVISFDATGHTIVTTVPKTETRQKTVETGESLSNSAYLYNNITYRQAILNVIESYVTINRWSKNGTTNNWQEQNNGYINAWNEIKTILYHYLKNVVGKNESDQSYDHLLTLFAWDDSDLHVFLDAIESRYNLGHASQNASYLADYQVVAQQQSTVIDRALRNESNNNLLWSWSDNSGKILMETKMGLSIDVQTFLGDYQPIDGQYGLRLILTGTTKPTETEMSREITETIYFTNDDMYGNTYGYYSPYTQQKIFDISNLLTLTHIDCYFWQEHDDNKHVFKDYNGDKIPYQMTVGDSTVLMEPNIIMANLQVIVGITAEEATEDRVLLYSYDDIEYGILPSEIDVQRSDEKELRLAWIHISSDGPVLVDHEKQLYATDVNSLEYWHAKIYWYNWQYGHPLNEGIEAEKYGGVNWKPKPFDNENAADEFAYSTTNTNYSLKITPSRDKLREKYRALILTDNTPIRSNVLEFVNRDTTVQDASFESLYDVVFRFLKGTVSSDGTQMKIVQDNSIGNFFVYDENNDVISDENGVAYSDIPYYVQVWIRNNETGDYAPASLDEENGIQEIVWEPLGYNSMITEFTEPADSELENTELTPLQGSMTDSQRRLLKMITRRFRINQKWIMKYTENFIRAKVIRSHNRVYQLQKELLFGQSGTMGSQYTIVLQQNNPENGEMIKDAEFKVTARIFERGIEKPSSKYKFEWDILSPTLVTATNSALTTEQGNVTNVVERSGTITSNDIGVWWNSTPKYSSTGGYQNNVISGYIRNDMPLILKCTCKNCADYTIATTQGFGLVNNTIITFNKNLSAQCPDRVEYKSDGTAPIADLMNFIVKKKRVSAQGKTAAACGCLFQDKYVDEDDDLNPQELYPTWKLFSYYMTRSYNTQTDPTTGKTIATGIKNIVLTGGPNPDTNGPSLISCLSLKSKTVDTKKITTDTGEEKTVPAHVEYSLNTSNNYSINGSSKIHGNSHAPANWYWDDAYATDYYVILQWQQTITVTNKINNSPVTESVTYWFKQAVPLTLNTYSSSLVNSWNGDLLIDYENNAILSKMMAAGSKNKNNQFTGVMMGDWATKGDSSLDIPGLYGFNDGRQVFGLRTNGTGFIGRSGKGQIQFDGNYALISNADKTCYINLDPVRYDYKYTDGQDIRIKNYNAYSQYFLWAESEATTKTDGSSIEDYRWANKLIQAAHDNNRDLFVVDPNNGILTTGGIYAKYGCLGKYLLLNDSGLIYKQHTNDDGKIVTINDDLTGSENNDIIYIGQERTRNGTLIPFEQNERQYDHYYWSADSYKISANTLSGHEQDTTDGSVLGRYVIWAGNKTGNKAYPKFGVEHDGTVHLTEAFVQGKIHASTLIIGDEDYEEADRNRAHKTFYTNVEKLSDLIGANPALLKDRPTDSDRVGLWGKKGGTCHEYYGDWLRPGDIWYIHSSSMKNVTMFVGINGNINHSSLENPFNLTYSPVSMTKYSIKFSNGSKFTYEEDTKKIKYTGKVEYTEYTMNNGEEQSTKTNVPSINVTDLEAELKAIDNTIKNYKYTAANGVTGSVDYWKEQYEQKQAAYIASPSSTTKTASKNFLRYYNAAQAGLQTHICTQKTLLSKYDGIYAQLETWSVNINSTNDTPLDKLSYSATTILTDKLLNQVVSEETIDDADATPNLPNELSGTDEDSLASQTVASTMSYTQLIWEGIQDTDNNHRWYGTWTNTNVIPKNKSINVGDKIEESQLLWDTEEIPNTITIEVNIPEGQENNTAVVTAAENEANAKFAKSGEPGYVHPQKIEKKMSGDFKKLQRFSAPPGWRIVGDVDSDSIWDALKHSTLNFNGALRATTSLLTTNLKDTFNKLLLQMNNNQEEALEELQRQRTELVNLLTNVQKNINNTVYQSAANIRNGMDPITFFDDGNCYVFLSQHPIDSNISGLGIVPAGLTIAQLSSDATDGTASTMYLNSKRMGFYRTFTKDKNGNPLTLNGADCPVTVPLLSYYNGSMALAGSLMLGLDYNNYIYGQGLDQSLKDIIEKNGGVIPESTVVNNSSGLGLYKNVIDGPNCRIVLGNGAIVIDGLDNGKGLNGKTNEPPFPGAPNNGKQEPQEKPVAQREGIPYIYIGRNNYYNPDQDQLIEGTKGVVRIGGRKNGQGMLSIADFDFSSTNFSNSITNLPTGISGSNTTLYYQQSYTFENASLIPRTQKAKNKETVQITYIENASNDGSNISISTASTTLNIDYYKTSNIDNWSPAEPFADTIQTPYKAFEINQDTIDFSGDILAITQQCEKQTNISPRYTGVGIMGSNDPSAANAQVIFGPIRYKRFEKLQAGSTVIDIKGYKDTTDLSNRCWLTGWNFYGLQVLAKNIFAAENIITEQAFYVKNNNKSLTDVKYLRILNEYEIKKEILDAKNSVLGTLNLNLENINISFQRIVDTINNFHDAFGQVGTILKAISDSVQTVSAGVNSAFAKAQAAMNVATTAIQTANTAIGKAQEAIAKSVADGWLLSNITSGETYPGTTDITLTLMLNPEWKGTNQYSQDRPHLTYTATSAAANYLHRHGFLVKTNSSATNGKYTQCTLEIGRVRGTDLSIGGGTGASPGVASIDISGDLEWVADSYDNNRLTSLRSVLNIGDKSIVLGRVSTYAKFMQLEDWHSLGGYASWESVNVNLGLGTNSTDSKKVQLVLPWRNDTSNELRINFYTALNEWTYSKEKIDQKVLEAFKKGWNDGWVADYIEAKSKDSSKQWYVHLMRPAYDGPGSDTLTIAQKSGIAANETHLNFELQYVSGENNKIGVYMTNSNITKGTNDPNPLAYAMVYLHTSAANYSTSSNIGYNSSEHTYYIKVTDNASATATNAHLYASNTILGYMAYNDGVEHTLNNLNIYNPYLTLSAKNGNDYSGDNYDRNVSFKAQAYKITATNDQSSTITSSTPSYTITLNPSIAIGGYNSSYKRYQFTYYLSVNGGSASTMAQGYVDASAAYNAGWAAAAGKFYRSGDTVYGPSSTVGGSASYSVSHTGYSRGSVYASQNAPSSYDLRNWTTISSDYSGTTSAYVTGWNHEGSYWVQYWNGDRWAYGSDGYAKSSYRGSTSEIAWAYLTGSAKGQLTWTDS